MWITRSGWQMGCFSAQSVDNSPRLVEAVNAFSCWLGLHTKSGGPHPCVDGDRPGRNRGVLHAEPLSVHGQDLSGYIALGKHTDALALLQRMLLYADYAHRTYIRLECRLLSAVILRRMGEPWKEDFVQTLKEIGEYHFVPILSEKGAAILPLLTEVKAAMCPSAPRAGRMVCAGAGGNDSHRAGSIPVF